MLTNNKFWSWTEKQLRKQRSINGKSWPGSPKWFRRKYTHKDRVSTKKAIKDELNSQDGIFRLRTSRHTADWDWA